MLDVRANVSGALTAPRAPPLYRYVTMNQPTREERQAVASERPIFPHVGLRGRPWHSRSCRRSFAGNGGFGSVQIQTLACSLSPELHVAFSEFFSKRDKPR